ncbi:hypothetical protein niasHT_022704 [Heterodera trifolii]|uniref:Uncharacterized protein n=1 Tax=Heterodera trifolii TaxID=157864 RepID=A0ABD2KMX3_9BILA
METANLGCIWLFRSLSACRHWRLNAWKLEDSPEDRSEDRLEDSPEDRLEDRTEEKNEESGPPTSHSLSSTTLSRTTRRSARLLLRHRFIFTVPPLHFCGQKVEQCLAEHQQAKSAWRGSSSQLNGCAIQSCVDSNQKTPPGHSGFEGHHNCLEFKTEVAKKHQNANKPPRFVSDLALLDASKLDDGTADE